MTGYRGIAESLRERIAGGEFPCGARLAGIGALRAEYGGVSLNTVRAAQQVLVDEGMLETRRGVGAFVVGTRPVRELDVVATLRQASGALATAIAAIESMPPATVAVNGGNADNDAEARATTPAPVAANTAGGQRGWESAGRRNQLLAAACRVIARRGVRGLRVEEVATEAGVSTALIYHHFRGRSGLVTNAMRYINDRLARQADSAAGGTGRRRLLRRMLSEFAEDDQTRENSAVWGEVRGAAIFDEELRGTVDGATEHWIDQLTELIAAGRQDGSIGGALDARGVAVRLTAMVEGLSNRWLAGLMSTSQAREHITATIRAELGG
ncbi:MAG: TetR family transcriptional regulator C-terminal domain-containing protein [Sciscionella sp.]